MKKTVFPVVAFFAVHISNAQRRTERGGPQKISSAKVTKLPEGAAFISYTHMKSIVVFFVIMSSLFAACNTNSGDIQTDPRSVAEAIFEAARSGKTEGLATLIDADADNDSKMIAQAATDKSIREEFQKYFSKAKVNGDPIIDGGSASVNILFGPDGTKEETFEMVQKDGKWYLVSF